MKRATLICAAVTAIAATILMAGCTTQTPGVTPTPTAYQSPTPGTTISPSVEPSPTIGIEETPLNTAGQTIPGFIEGKVVQPDEVPDIVDAIEVKYPGASIESITHALYLNEEVYEIVLKEADGTIITVYVAHDGATITEAAGSPSPATT